MSSENLPFDTSPVAKEIKKMLEEQAGLDHEEQNEQKGQEPIDPDEYLSEARRIFNNILKG